MTGEEVRARMVDAAVAGLPATAVAPHESRRSVAEGVVDEILDRFPNLVLDPPTPLYRVDRPRARGTDPETSQDAATRVRDVVRRPGGTVHRLLTAYAEERTLDDAAVAVLGEHARPATGMTAREVEERARVKAAHKRTSELLADGLLAVVRVDGSDLIRDGSRVLEITDDGLRELRRLDARASS